MRVRDRVFHERNGGASRRRIRLLGIVCDQAGGPTERSRGSQRSGNPREQRKKRMRPRRGCQREHVHPRRSCAAAGIPPGCVPSASSTGGLRCAATAGYCLAALRAAPRREPRTGQRARKRRTLMGKLRGAPRECKQPSSSYPVLNPWANLGQDALIASARGAIPSDSGRDRLGPSLLRPRAAGGRRRRLLPAPERLIADGQVRRVDAAVVFRSGLEQAIQDAARQKRSFHVPRRPSGEHERFDPVK